MNSDDLDQKKDDETNKIDSSKSSIEFIHLEEQEKISKILVDGEEGCNVNDLEDQNKVEDKESALSEMDVESDTNKVVVVDSVVIDTFEDLEDKEKIPTMTAAHIENSPKSHEMNNSVVENSDKSAKIEKETEVKDELKNVSSMDVDDDDMKLTEVSDKSVKADEDLNSSDYSILEPKTFETISEKKSDEKVVETIFDMDVEEEDYVLPDPVLKEDNSKSDSPANIPDEKSNDDLLDKDTKKTDDGDISDSGFDDEILFIDDDKSGPSAKPEKQNSFKDFLKTSFEKKDNCQRSNSIVIEDIEEDAKSSPDLKLKEDKTEQSKGIETEIAEKTTFETGKKRVISIDDDEGADAKRPKVDSVPEPSETMSVDASRTSSESPKPDNVLKQDSEKQTSSTSVSENSVCISSEVLQGFIRGCVSSFLKKRKQDSIERLKKQITSMQSASTLWKETAKHLEKSVLDLNHMSKRLEKRQSHASSLKSQSNRSVGVQVCQEIIPTCKTLSPVAPEPILRKPVEQKTSMSSSLSLPPSVLLNPPQQYNAPVNKSPSASIPGRHPGPSRFQPPQRQLPQQRPRFQNVQNTPPNPQHQKTSPNKQILHYQNGRIAGSQTSSPKSNVNCIDLTDEEESTNRSSQGPRTPHAIAPKPQQMSNHPNGMIQQSSAQELSTPSRSSGMHSGSGNQIRQQSVPQSKSQLMPSVTTPGSQFQLVSVNNSPGGKSGMQPGQMPLFALVPSPNSANPAPVQRVPGNIAQRNSVGGVNVNHASKSLPQTSTKTVHSLPPSVHINVTKHPAPLPAPPVVPNVPSFAQKSPPKPQLNISRVPEGIVLSWNMPKVDGVEVITSYQLFAYQESDNVIASTHLWKKVGDVKALPLPMACTLTQFQVGNKYHFAVRAVDQYGRCGSYSDPSTIFLGPK